MRAIFIHGPNDVRTDTVTDPKAGPRDVVVQLAACGVCGTDLNFIKHGGAGPNLAQPLPIGHEPSGTIIEVGKDVAGVKIGMRVAINPMGKTGVIGNGAPEGAFADRLLVREAVLGETLLELPQALPMEVAALAEPLAVSLHAVNRAEPKSGQKAVVFGAGPIGLGIILWLHRAGIKDIIAVDPHPARLARAKELGATNTLQANDADIVAGIIKLHGRATNIAGKAADSDLYFDAAGAANVVPDIIRAAKRFVKLVIVAVYHEKVEIDFLRMLRKEMWITTSVGYPTELGDVLRTLPSLGAEIKHYVTGQFSFDQFDAAIAAANDRSSGKIMITFDTKE